MGERSLYPSCLACLMESEIRIVLFLINRLFRVLRGGCPEDAPGLQASVLTLVAWVLLASRKSSGEQGLWCAPGNRTRSSF